MPAPKLLYGRASWDLRKRNYSGSKLKKCAMRSEKFYLPKYEKLACETGPYCKPIHHTGKTIQYPDNVYREREVIQLLKT